MTVSAPDSVRLFRRAGLDSYSVLSFQAEHGVHASLLHIVTRFSPALVGATGLGNCILVSDISQRLRTMGDAGFSFERGNHTSLKERLEVLIRRGELVREYGQKAWARVQSIYSWDKIADDTEKLDLSLLAKGSMEDEDSSDK